MPKVAYNDEEKEQVRRELVEAGLELITKQGIQHTTVEQIYKKVGISRTFFYSFFSTKEDLIVEALYLQQPKIIDYAKSLMADSNLKWKEAVRKFIYSCCYGEKYGIAVLTIDEQQIIFKRLSKESYKVFRRRQAHLFGSILECFGVKADKPKINMLTNLVLTVMVIRRAIPETLPLFIPEAAEETVEFQIDSIVNYIEKMRI